MPRVRAPIAPRVRASIAPRVLASIAPRAGGLVTARARLSVAVVLLAAAALAGCKSQGPERAMARFHGDDAVRNQAIARAPATNPAAETSAARATADVDSAAERDGAPPQTAARPGSEPGQGSGSGQGSAAPLPEVDANPERFLGVAAAALGAELGRPALVRAEGPARVWQYRGPTCVLDMVLYPGTDGPTVRHLEARDPADAKPHDTATCLKTLLQRRALAATG